MGPNYFLVLSVGRLENKDCLCDQDETGGIQKLQAV